MTGNKNAWRAPLAGLASVAMIATMGVAASTANAAGAGTVTLDANGGTINTNQTTMAYDDAGDGAADGKLRLLYDANHTPNPATGYTFTGWYTSPKGGKAVGPADKVTADSTLYAHYTTSSNNTVTFSDAANGYDETAKAGSDVAFIVESGDDVTVTLAEGDNLAGWQIPDNSDVKFDGWRNVADGKTADLATLTTNGEDEIVLEENPVSGAVIYRIPDGWTADKVQWSTGKKGAKAIALPADQAFPTVYYTNNEGKPVKQAAWTADGTHAAAAADKTAGATLTLLNKETPAYRADLKFTTDGSDDVKAGDYQYFEGTGYTKIDTKDLSSYETAEGYTFVGWYTQGNLTVKLNGKFFKDVFTSNNAADVYGQFRANADTVEVTFDPYYDGAAKTVKTLAKGSYFGDSLPTPARDGYVFKGWYQETSFANAVTKDTKVADFDTNNDGKTTVYAQWESSSLAELNDLLGLRNVYLKNASGKWYPALYSQNSFAAYNEVRDAVASKIYKDYGITPTADGRMNNGSGYAYTVYGIPSSDLKKISDEDLKVYVDELKAAQAKLEVVPDLEGAYTDVNKLTPHYTDILSLTAQGVIKGYADKTFRGMDGLNRQDFAAYLYRLAGEPAFDAAKAENPFADVNESTPHYTEILWAASKGIIKGYEENGKTLFKGMDLINRQDAAAMLYRLAGSPVYTVNFGAFADVTEATPHYKEILWAASKGIVRGYADGTFNGYSTIVRQDAAAFLNRMADKVADYLK